MSIGLHTPADLAAMFDTTELQVLEWRRQHSWPSIKVGKTIRFTDEQVEAIIAIHSTKPTRAAAATPVIQGQTARSARRAS